MSNNPTPSASNPPSRTTTPARFTNTTETLEDALKTQTVGLVHLSDFKKRRQDLAEQREREAAEKHTRAGTGTPASSSREGSEAPDRGARAAGVAKKKRKGALSKGKLSFGDDEEVVEEPVEKEVKTVLKEDSPEDTESDGTKKKRKVNPNLKQPPPKAMTKSTLLREAQERETLRREFLALQESIKNEEITIPFVFYDGTNVLPPDGQGVKVKKGEAVWLFLERARRISNRREWLRVSVDDLLLVRGEVIIPHHYEFYYFIVNQTEGPNGVLFDYPSPLDPPNPNNPKANPDSATQQGGKEDPTMTKVVDRRWYERNKHIFPASVWMEFDPNMKYKGMVRRDHGGNAFFFG
ncbi:hypothetical protein RUND412_000022 [Rhizina undulata]